MTTPREPTPAEGLGRGPAGRTSGYRPVPPPSGGPESGSDPTSASLSDPTSASASTTTSKRRSLPGAGLLQLDTWVRAVYLLSRFPVGLFWFIALVVGLSVGVGLAIIFVGLAIVAGVLVMVRYGAILERELVHLAGGPRIDDPYRQPPEGSLVSRSLARLRDPALYRDALYLFLQFPIGLVTFVIMMVTLWVPGAALAMPLFYNRVGSQRVGLFNTGNDGWLVIDSLPKALLVALVGLVLLPLIPLVIRGWSALHFAIAVLLLGPTRSTEVSAAVAQRDMGLAADMSERKRIERNLHDGAQQRLVAMTMELGRAKAKLDTDPESARELLDSAQVHAKAAMQELRDLARGIAPPLLTDRGLDAALSALAARSPIPVQLEVDVDRRLPESVESTAYFVIAESLTNAAKHSGATIVLIRVVDRGSDLSLAVSDNGRGGVDATGSGIVGLADRVRSVGGTFMAQDADDAGVTIMAELPCGW